MTRGVPRPPQHAAMNAISALLLAGLALGLLGAPCGRPFRSLSLDTPQNGHLVDDPSGTVAASARVGTNFDATSVQVRLDGVDLVSALGLSFPFTDAGGVLAIGSDIVTLSGFDFTPTNPRRISFTASGFSVGIHDLQVEGEKLAGGLVSDTAAFEVIASLEQAAAHLTAGGGGPQDAGAEGFLFSSSLGEPLAGPPTGLSGGGELRPGFIGVMETLRVEGLP